MLMNKLRSGGMLEHQSLALGASSLPSMSPRTRPLSYLSHFECISRLAGMVGVPSAKPSSAIRAGD